MMKKVALVWSGFAFFLTGISASASVIVVSTHHSRHYQGKDALQTCEQAASRIQAEFPTKEAELHEVHLIDAVCEPVENDRVTLAIVYSHPTSTDLHAEAIDLDGDLAGCQEAVPSTRSALHEAGLPPVSVFCTKKAQLIAEFIQPLPVSYARMGWGPSFRTASGCHTAYAELLGDVRAAGFFPVMGTCSRVPSSTDADEWAYVTDLIYAGPLNEMLHRLYAKTATTELECVSDLRLIGERLMQVELPPVRSFCYPDGTRWREVVDFKGTLTNRLKTEEGPRSSTQERCQTTLERMKEALARDNLREISAYCEERFTWDGKAMIGFQPVIHSVSTLLRRQ